MKLKTLLSVLLVYRHNFQVIHWMAHGENFLTIHAKSAECYEALTEDIDTVAEMILRDEDTIVSYSEALEILEECDHGFTEITGKDMIDMEGLVAYGTKMFNDLLHCTEKILDSDYIKEDHRVGIKATLEGMHDKYDLQANYLIKRLKK